MERNEALIERLMKRIALVEIHHQTGKWIDERDIVLKKTEKKKA